ncbi:MAG TPA: hypothetical protein VFH08_01605 [Chitinophagaceae bacterium]|nr:hypothetical protein [Chitinophagaceae bacterium]
MKPLLFQLVYQAASTVLLLLYVNKYQLGQKQHDQGGKQRVMKNVLAREDSDRGRSAVGTANSSYINVKAAKNEQ